MEITVVDSPDRHRFEGYADGTLAGFIDYRREEPSRLALTHAETVDGFGGKGIASAIAKFALDSIRKDGLSLRPACPFVADYLTRHHEYADLIQQ